MYRCCCAVLCSVLSNCFATQRSVAHKPPLSMEFSRQEYWTGLPFPTPGDLPDPRIKPMSPALAGDYFTTEPQGKPLNLLREYSILYLHLVKA